MNRISAKFSEATRCAKIIGLPLILIGAGCRGRLHCHSAYRIDRRRPSHGWSRLHHRKGSSCGRLTGTSRLGLQRPLRIGLESSQAGQAAKVIALASMIVTSGCRSRIDCHPADWIDRHLSSEGLLSVESGVLSLWSHRHSTLSTFEFTSSCRFQECSE